VTDQPTAAELRYATLRRAELDVYRQVILESAEDIAQVAAAMDAAGLSEMNIDGARKFVRGQQLLAEFVGKCEIAVSRARAAARQDDQRSRVEGGA
tara:strand:+ start:270 stop:557 length:288 start_codon:yes stop_codon:yes gene_type:complete